MNEPLTAEGFETWDIIRRYGGQIRLHPNGDIAGFDVPTIFSITEALGYDLQAMLLLLDHAEAGLREAVKKNADSSHTEHRR